MILFININTYRKYYKWERLSFESLSCGERGIRTLETKKVLPILNRLHYHSAISGKLPR